MKTLAEEALRASDAILDGMIEKALREFQDELDTLLPEVTSEHRIRLLEAHRSSLTAWRDASLARLKAKLEQLELPAERRGLH
ncbi:hypothetical protein RLW55_03220 [Hyphomicrobium sp. B1]|uniref:hypothetical protein n=1 Tax=Hyphomicrobium sp. B1 TaxID=3075651 RepID=UPI003C2D6536